MIHLKEALVSKEAFSRENSQMGGFEILIELVRKNFRGGGDKNSCVQYFFEGC